MPTTLPLWHPSPEKKALSRMESFRGKAQIASGLPLENYSDLHDWSVACPGPFWSLAWDFCGLVGEKGAEHYVHHSDPLAAEFFPRARLNVLDTFLRNPDDHEAIIFEGENGQRLVWTRAELHAEVTALATALQKLGITKGDHVVGYVPNMPQTVAVMLATASLGAVWSSCAPESGPDVVVDRFKQLAPKVMFVADGYFYGGKTFDTFTKTLDVARRLPSLLQVVAWPYASDAEDLPAGFVTYDAFKIEVAPELKPTRIGFSDPLYVLLSSGTTGKPKCIEHSGGGSLLRLMVEHQLHCDLHAGDRMLYFNTCNWMMWNWQVAALVSEATIFLYDCNPKFLDATLNPGGIRIGTAEIYRQIERIAAIQDAVVVGKSMDNDVQVLLFAKLSEGVELNEALITQIKAEIRTNASPRHVPPLVLAVPAMPHTKSGKTAELAVSDIVNNRPIRDASGLANPDALNHFKDHPLLQISKDKTNAA